MPSSSARLASDPVDLCNQALYGASATEVLHWTLAQSDRVVLSTSFGPDSAVLLKMTTDLRPDIPVIWVDTGYNTAATYRFAERLISDLRLNLCTYQPARSAAHISAVLGTVPLPGDAGYDSFTRELKLDPFRRALADHQPDFWISGVRRSETLHRRTMNLAEPGPGDIIKIAPLLHWSDQDVADYVRSNNLPSEPDYHDVTKVTAARECGLHCRL